MSSRSSMSGPNPTVVVRASSPPRRVSGSPVSVKPPTSSARTPPRTASASVPRPSSPPRSPAPRVSEKLDDLMVLLDSESVEEKLQNRGFVVSEKIIVNKDGEDVVRYMKARTMAGDIVLIDPESDDGYVVRSGSVVKMSVQEAKIVNEEVIAKAYDCAKSITCGVALECENGICVLNEPSDAETPGLPPNRTVLTTVKGDDSVYIGMYSVPYPVVSLAHIMADPKAVIENAHRAVLKMRSERKAIHDPIVESLVKTADEIEDTIEKFANKREEAHAKVEANIVELEKMRMQYDEMDTKGELDSEDLEANIANRAKYTETLKRLKYSHDLLEALERQTVEMASLGSLLKDIHARVKLVQERTDDIASRKWE